MVLLFKGEDAVRKVRSVVGNISMDRRGGETIRDTYGDLIIDETSRQVSVDGHPVHLTSSEYGILVLLARHPGKAFARLRGYLISFSVS